MTNELPYNHSLLFSMPLPQENNRSVILERYTYKSDEGKLLKPSLDQNLNTNLDINRSRAVKLNDTSMEEKNIQEVRTEHCDSTTDLIEDFELDSRKMIKLYENICNTSPNTSTSDLDYNNKTTKPQTIHIDSDSDCEIIDSDDQMNASVSNSSDNTPQDSNIDSVTKIDENIEMYVISDSDDEFNENAMTPEEEADTDLLHFEENSSDRLPDISISKIISPQINPQSHSQLIIQQINDTMKQLLKPKSSILENTINNSFINSVSGINDSEPPMSTTTTPTSPDNRKSEFYSYLKINTNPLAQKTEAVAQNRRSNRVKKRHSRNPDTNNDHEMPSEFNDSEKSNDNLQNTKTPEKTNETRKKYLKYSKQRVIFPPPPAHVCDIINFETSIEQYFQEESIDYKKSTMIHNKKTQFTNGLKRKYKTNEILIKKKKQKLVQDQKQETVQINKKFRKSKILNGDSLNGGKNNKQKLYIKRPYSKDKMNKPKFYIKRTYTKRKNQNNTNIGTSTEENIANTNHVSEPEMEDTEEVLKKNSCTVTKNHSNTSCLEATTNSHDEISTKNNVRTCFDDNTNTNGLNGMKTLDNCDLLSQNVSDTINKDCNKLLDDIATRTSCNSDCSESDEELDDLNNEKSHSPLCLGFTHDDNSQRICKNMQDAVTSVANSPAIRDSVDKPEPIILPEIITISEDDENTASVQTPLETIDTATIQMDHPKQIPFDPNVRGKSFLRSLMERKRKSSLLYPDKVTEFDISDSDSTISKASSVKKAQTHRIDINRNDGPIFSAYYMNGLVTIVQEQLVSFWKQTALGNILGVQNMWVPAGSVNRIVLDRGCVNKRSPEMILGVDKSVAYIELWTKEHKYVFREASVCDIFATIYYHNGNGPPDKKVLQLENIKGYGNDVQYAVTKNSREIIVSWYDTFNKLPNEPIQTLIRSYQLAPDFQSVESVKVIAPVPHYISWLHNVQDSDSLLMGSGHDKISVWNIKEGGHLLKTLDLTDNTIPQTEDSKTICLYGQCETGFLFLIQQVNIGVLRLVAVNGRTYDWKQLYSYTVPENYKKLLGVIVESGVLMTCYTNGFLCWNMHSGEILAEIDTNSDNIVIPSNKYLISILDYKVTVEHIMSYILTHEW